MCGVWRDEQRQQLLLLLLLLLWRSHEPPWLSLHTLNAPPRRPANAPAHPHHTGQGVQRVESQRRAVAGRLCAAAAGHHRPVVSAAVGAAHGTCGLRPAQQQQRQRARFALAHAGRHTPRHAATPHRTSTRRHASRTHPLSTPQHTRARRINNAGTNAYKYGPLLESDDEDLEAIVDTNILGVMLCCKEVRGAWAASRCMARWLCRLCVGWLLCRAFARLLVARHVVAPRASEPAGYGARAKHHACTQPASSCRRLR
jgi:hypothetical protein